MHIHESRDAARTANNHRPSPAPLKVVCFSTYVSDPERQTPRHRDVRNFLLALRGERFEGVSKIPVHSEERELAAMNANDSIDWFGEMVVDYLLANGVATPFALVPVPTSKATLDSSAGPWTSLLAISIASNGLDDVEVVDALRWRKALDPPSQRSDSVNELYENLAATRRLDPDVPAVLVDYLYTASDTIRACAARLGDQGISVPLALCAGRTTGNADHGAFTVVVGDVAPFEPGH
jgi:hypothetical protein